MCKPNCSKCCEFMVVAIAEQVNDDWEWWASLHKGVEAINIQGRWFLKIDRPCDKLVNGRCSIQETKPKLCTAFDCEEPQYQPFKYLLE